MESSVLDQLRLQEGRLFQSEAILALYLDIKAVLNEALITKSIVDFNEDYLLKLEDTLKVLAPKGVPDYHAQSLNECIKTVARLLWPSEHLLVARPNLNHLFKGLLTRITRHESFTHYQALDPIKKDFVIREAFRRTLVNDCLTVFPNEEIGEHDSASQMIKEEDNVSLDSFSRPVGARSCLNGSRTPVEESSAEPFKETKELKVVESLDLIRSTAIASDLPSIESKSVATNNASSISRQPLKLESNLDILTKQVSDSASCAGSAILFEMPSHGLLNNRIGQKSGSSVLSKALSVSGPSRAPSVVAPVVAPVSVELVNVAPEQGTKSENKTASIIQSIMPKVTSAPECHKSVKTSASASSSNTISTLHKPINVRKVILEEGE